MHVITARNVEDALFKGLSHLKYHGVEANSRNGPVIVNPVPVTTQYHRPRERVLFWPERDANPFFHFFESLWMLAGRNDIGFLTQFVKRMADYSDDGITQHGAYGYRWRNHFDMEGGGHPSLPDQLPIIIDRLKKYPEDRRCVLAMWDPVADLGSTSKDVCCNTSIYFWRQEEYLHMTVCCRSNDIIWGAYGANAVHFSVLQEYMAAGIGCEVGTYWQISNNFHAYKDLFNKLYSVFCDEGSYKLRYGISGLEPYPIVRSFEDFDDELEWFLSEPNRSHILTENPFFFEVAWPMLNAHYAYKTKCYDDAIKILSECKAGDWKLAATQWVQRRKANFERAKDNGVSYEASK